MSPSDFVKFWCGPEWGQRLWALKGNSLRVLCYLLSDAQYGNRVPSPSALGEALQMSRSLVSRAYGELLRAEFFVRFKGSYGFHPLFCWRGSDKGFQAALSQLRMREFPRRKRKVIPQGRKAVAEVGRMLRGGN